MTEKKYHSYDDALSKLQSFCAYQERCHKEVRQKIIDLGIYGDDVDQIIASLIEDNYVNEMRFAELYVGGKFRIKKWGKYKIIKELKYKYISEYCIKKAIKSEISDEDYYDTLVHILEKKEPLIRESNPFKRKLKLAKYTIDKGYESALVWEVIRELYP